jgi:hypothetical protein
MPKWNDCNLIAFGFVMGAVAGLMICTVAALNVRPLFLGNDGRLQWETLITGVVAVGAAWFTVDQLKRQIRQTGDLAERARQQRVKAARAASTRSFATNRICKVLHKGALRFATLFSGRWLSGPIAGRPSSLGITACPGRCSAFAQRVRRSYGQ